MPITATPKKDVSKDVSQAAPSASSERTFNLAKCPAGNIADGFFHGEPVNFAKDFLLCRGGVPVGHSLRVPFQDSYPSRPPTDADGNALPLDVPRLPTPFPPADYAKPLISIQDWFDCIEANALYPEPVARPEPVADPKS